MIRFVGVSLTVLTILAASAAGKGLADGLPVGGVAAGPGGVTSPSSDLRYLAMPAAQNTLALSVRKEGGWVRSRRLLRGRYTVPVVALDGTVDGLSADGSTLVLMRPRNGFPRSTTTFAVLDTNRLRIREVVRLRGDFSYDAMSPDGGLVYLIQYTSRRDPTRYAVRAYDTRARRLLPDPIIDPRAFGEGMRGYPITRATSPDHLWAYTLYDGAGKHPFVHALNTRNLKAACIDLHGLTGRRDLTALGLDVSPSGRELTVVDARSRPLAAVNTRTFKVRNAAADRTIAGGDSVMSPGAWLAGAAVVFAGMGVLLWRRRSTVAAA